jgi:hypothetical protein
MQNAYVDLIKSSSSAAEAARAMATSVSLAVQLVILPKLISGWAV